IAPGAARLLGVGFERAGELVVDDKAHVVLVYAHTEGHRRHDDPRPPGDKGVLRRLAFAALHAGVVVHGAHTAAAPQVIGDLFAALTRAHIDDAGAGRLAHDVGEGLQPVVVVGDTDHLVAEVGAVDAAVDHHQFTPKSLGDTLAHLGRCRRGERQHGDGTCLLLALTFTPLAQCFGDEEVGGAEVMAPEADAVRLIHDEARDAGPA